MSTLNNLLIVGDFNYHVNNTVDSHARALLGTLDSCGLTQHVHLPTHVKGNTLDLVFSREGELNPNKICIDTSVPSDHFTVLFNINIKKVKINTKISKSRNWKTFSLDRFISDLKDAGLDSVLQCNDLSDALDKYNYILDAAFNEHAPFASKTNKRQHLAKWYNDSIRKAKRIRRQCERRWRKSKLNIDWEEYRAACNDVNYKLNEARKNYYHNLLSKSTSHKETYQIANTLLSGKANKILPSYESSDELAKRFATYFNEKIESI